MIHLSIGRRTRGKTTLAWWCANRVPRRLAFDPRGVIRNGSTVTTREALIAAYAELLDRERMEIVFTPDGDIQEGFELFAWHCRQWVKRFPRKPIAIVVDEAAFVSTEVEWFMWVLRCSDPAAVHVFMTAHRPADIRTDVRAIADHWFLFAVRQEHDLRVVAERCGPAVVELVSKLDAREFVHWDDAHGAYAVNRNPAGWFVELDRYPGPRQSPPVAELAARQMSSGKTAE